MERKLGCGPKFGAALGRAQDALLAAFAAFGRGIGVGTRRDWPGWWECGEKGCEERRRRQGGRQTQGISGKDCYSKAARFLPFSDCQCQPRVAGLNRPANLRPDLSVDSPNLPGNSTLTRCSSGNIQMWSPSERCFPLRISPQQSSSGLPTYQKPHQYVCDRHWIS